MKKFYKRLKEKLKQIFCMEHHYTKHVIYSLASRPTLYVCKKCGYAILKDYNKI